MKSRWLLERISVFLRTWTCYHGLKMAEFAEVEKFRSSFREAKDFGGSEAWRFRHPSILTVRLCFLYFNGLVICTSRFFYNTCHEALVVI